MNLTIKHVKENGQLLDKQLNDVHDITYDIGFEYLGLNVPAVKFHRDRANAYHLIQVHDPEKLVMALKPKLTNRAVIVLDADIFDPKLLDAHEARFAMEEFEHALIFEAFKIVGLRKVFSMDAMYPFKNADRLKILNGDLKPLMHKHVPKLAELWRRTLPTPHRPQGVSKLQYFENLINRSNTHYARLVGL